MAAWWHGNMATWQHAFASCRYAKRTRDTNAKLLIHCACEALIPVPPGLGPSDYSAPVCAASC
eukprot:141073-Pyramimonas_sp.AAC.1